MNSKTLKLSSCLLQKRAYWWTEKPSTTMSFQKSNPVVPHTTTHQFPEIKVQVSSKESITLNVPEGLFDESFKTNFETDRMQFYDDTSDKLALAAEKARMFLMECREREAETVGHNFGNEVGERVRDLVSVINDVAERVLFGMQPAHLTPSMAQTFQPTSNAEQNILYAKQSNNNESFFGSWFSSSSAPSTPSTPVQPATDFASLLNQYLPSDISLDSTLADLKSLASTLSNPAELNALWIKLQKMQVGELMEATGEHLVPFVGGLVATVVLMKMLKFIRSRKGWVSGLRKPTMFLPVNGAAKAKAPIGVPPAAKVPPPSPSAPKVVKK